MFCKITFEDVLEAHRSAYELGLGGYQNPCDYWQDDRSVTLTASYELGRWHRQQDMWRKIAAQKNLSATP